MIVLELFKLMANIVYLPFKLLKTKNKVTFISRQSNNISFEFKLIVERLRKENINVETKTIAKKLEPNLKSIFINTFLMFKLMYHIATSKVVVVDGYSIPISILKHKKDLIVIQTWHANVMVKKIGLQTLETRSPFQRRLAIHMNMHKNYSYVISSSKEATKVFSEAFDISKDRILEFGTPILDYIYNEEFTYNKEHIIKKIKIEKPVVLYLPTYRKGRGVDYSSLINNFDFKNYNLVIKLHPVDNKTPIGVDDRVKFVKDIQTEDLFSIAEYVISDYSNTAFLAGLAKKKVLFYVNDIIEYRKSSGLNIDLLSEFGKYTFKDIKKLLDVIYNNDYDFKYLESFINKYITTFDGKSTERIINFILDIVSK